MQHNELTMKMLSYRHAPQTDRREYPSDSSITGRFHCEVTRQAMDVSGETRDLYKGLSTSTQASSSFRDEVTFDAITLRLKFR